MRPDFDGGMHFSTYQVNETTWVEAWEVDGEYRTLVCGGGKECVAFWGDIAKAYNSGFYTENKARQVQLQKDYDWFKKRKKAEP